MKLFGPLWPLLFRKSNADKRNDGWEWDLCMMTREPAWADPSRWVGVFDPVIYPRSFSGQSSFGDRDIGSWMLLYLSDIKHRFQLKITFVLHSAAGQLWKSTILRSISYASVRSFSCLYLHLSDMITTIRYGQVSKKNVESIHGY